jgi:hypothetical protein
MAVATTRRVLNQPSLKMLWSATFHIASRHRLPTPQNRWQSTLRSIAITDCKNDNKSKDQPDAIKRSAIVTASFVDATTNQLVDLRQLTMLQNPITVNVDLGFNTRDDSAKSNTIDALRLSPREITSTYTFSLLAHQDIQALPKRYLISDWFGGKAFFNHARLSNRMRLIIPQDASTRVLLWVDLSKELGMLTDIHAYDLIQRHQMYTDYYFDGDKHPRIFCRVLDPRTNRFWRFTTLYRNHMLESGDDGVRHKCRHLNGYTCAFCLLLSGMM